jgi:hypothetical protein
MEDGKKKARYRPAERCESCRYATPYETEARHESYAYFCEAGCSGVSGFCVCDNWEKYNPMEIDNGFDGGY